MNTKKFEVLEKIVKSGNSKVLSEWKALSPTLTDEGFLEALKWLCEDPENGGNGRQMTREIGLTPEGIVRLDRVYSGNEMLCSFYTQDGKLWSGAIFTVPCDNPDFADENGNIKSLQKIALSIRDRI